jgi:hypothetical protein
MARRSTKALDGGRPDNEREELSNRGARQAAIRGAYRTVYDLEAEIAALEATYIKPLKEERTQAWRNAKGDTNIAIADLKLGYRAFKRANDAEGFDDEGERDAVRDGLKEVFETLQPGAIFDLEAFIAAGEGFEAARPDDEGDKDLRPSFLRDNEASTQNGAEAPADA